MDSEEYKLKKQIKLDLERISITSLGSVADFIKTLLLQTKQLQNPNREKTSLYGCISGSGFSDNFLDQMIADSRQEILESLEKKSSDGLRS